jgi:hypothetical protein
VLRMDGKAGSIPGAGVEAAASVYSHGGGSRLIRERVEISGGQEGAVGLGGSLPVFHCG